MSLAPLTASGLLPAGDHPLTIEQLRQSYLVTGRGLEIPNWDALWRGQLVDNLQLFVGRLWQVGAERVFVNGSFVTDKPHPGDIDAYFECEITGFPQIVVGLYLQEPPLPWDWERRPIDPLTGIPKLLMWHTFKVEIFPHFTDQPNPTGIRDEYGNDLLFPSLFRRDKETSQPKGVIQVLRE